MRSSPEVGLSWQKYTTKKYFYPVNHDNEHNNGAFTYKPRLCARQLASHAVSLFLEEGRSLPAQPALTGEESWMSSAWAREDYQKWTKDRQEQDGQPVAWISRGGKGGESAGRFPPAGIKSAIDSLVNDFLAQKKIAVVGVSDKRKTGCNLGYRKF